MRKQPGNAANVWVGRKDEGITVEGEAALELAAQQLSEIEFSHIFSSPLQRARVTAEAVALAQRQTPQILIRTGLQERDFGEFEGETKTDENRHMLDQAATVEPLESLCVRLQPVLTEVSALQGNILLVSHSAVYKCLVEKMGYQVMPEKSSLNNVDWVRMQQTSNIHMISTSCS